MIYLLKMTKIQKSAFYVFRTLQFFQRMVYKGDVPVWRKQKKQQTGDDEEEEEEEEKGGGGGGEEE